MAAPAVGTEDVARLDFLIWSTTASLVVTDPDALDTAGALLHNVLDEVDATCSRFRPDSELNRILRRPGDPVELSPMLNAAMTQALRAASATDHLVDPTVAAAVIAAGYDRDIAAVLNRPTPVRAVHGGSAAGAAAPGAWRLRHDPNTATLTVPPGVGIDLGATAKAFAADLAATRIAGAVDGGVLVALGGDIAVAGTAPEGGWRITVADDHRARTTPHQTVSITSGGLATSSTTTRRWPSGTGWKHHIIDPRTGANPDPRWRTASVAAATCVDANAAATAAIILGDQAVQWLAAQHLPALLVTEDGDICGVARWPAAQEAR